MYDPDRHKSTYTFGIILFILGTLSLIPVLALIGYILYLFLKALFL